MALNQLSRQNTTNSLDAESNSPILTVTDVARQLSDIKEQQESIMEKVLTAMAGADETTIETNKQLLLLHSRCLPKTSNN